MVVPTSRGRHYATSRIPVRDEKPVKGKNVEAEPPPFRAAVVIISVKRDFKPTKLQEKN